MVVSIGSNSVSFIDTATNAVKHVTYVGRSPHEAFFTSDGRELWVTVRGENYVSVIDPTLMKETRRIEMANGPGMTMFGPDGRYAFVCSSFTPEMAILDVTTHQILKRVPQASPFCPNIAVSPDNDEVWITLKDVGKVQVFSARPPFDQRALLETGPITNHVNFVNNGNGKFAYVTIGGADEVKVFRRGASPTLVATVPVGPLPHGVWPAGDGSRVGAAHPRSRNIYSSVYTTALAAPGTPTHRADVGHRQVRRGRRMDPALGRRADPGAHRPRHRPAHRPLP